MTLTNKRNSDDDDASIWKSCTDAIKLYKKEFSGQNHFPSLFRVVQEVGLRIFMFWQWAPIQDISNSMSFLVSVLLWQSALLQVLTGYGSCESHLIFQKQNYCDCLVENLSAVPFEAVHWVSSGKKYKGYRFKTSQFSTIVPIMQPQQVIFSHFKKWINCFSAFFAVNLKFPKGAKLLRKAEN